MQYSGCAMDSIIISSDEEDRKVPSSPTADRRKMQDVVILDPLATQCHNGTQRKHIKPRARKMTSKTSACIVLDGDDDPAPPTLVDHIDLLSEEETDEQIRSSSSLIVKDAKETVFFDIADSGSQGGEYSSSIDQECVNRSIRFDNNCLRPNVASTSIDNDSNDKSTNVHKSAKLLTKEFSSPEMNSPGTALQSTKPPQHRIDVGCNGESDYVMDNVDGRKKGSNPIAVPSRVVEVEVEEPESSWEPSPVWLSPLADPWLCVAIRSNTDDSDCRVARD
eukprot:CFRG7860T1